MSRLASLVCLLISLTLLSGCATRPSTDIAALNETPWGAVDLISTASAAAIVTPRRTPTVLLLSGGGANGAFGAGVLYGWSRTGRRPEFDVISGVSAGALMGTLVFAGRAYDPELKRNFTEIGIDDVAKPVLPFKLLDGLADSTPLRKRIEAVITEKTLGVVADRHRRGQRLYVTTTNLDTGDPVTWDMGAIASSGRVDRLQRFQDILVASAAIPAFYKPVYITLDDGTRNGPRQMHVDGSLKFPVPLSPVMLPLTSPARIYFVVNGYLERPSQSKLVEPNLASIGSRSLNEMSWSQFDVSYRNLRESSIKRGDTLTVLAVPDSYKDALTLVDFDKKKMANLFALGAKIGAEISAAPKIASQ